VLTRRLLFAFAAVLVLARPASASAVTSVTVSGHVVGGSNQSALLSVTVACDSGVSYVPVLLVVYPLILSQVPGNDYSANCGTLQYAVSAKPEVPEPTNFQIKACLRAYNGFCDGPAVFVALVVDPPQYTLTVTPIAGSTQVTLRLVRNPGLRTDGYQNWVTYGLGEPACGPQGRRATMFGSTVQFSSVSLPASGPFVIYQCGPSFWWSGWGDFRTGYAVARADPPQPQQTVRVRAAIDFQGVEPAAGVPLPATAHVPLGATFHLEAIDQSGNDVPATFVLGMATPAPDIAPKALFRTLTLVRYTADETSSASAYQAFHKGRVKITVKPTDPSITGGTVTVEVEAPASLGTAVPDIDPQIITVAHRYGVPPAFIKAHAEKESSLNRLAYRYEPIGAYGDLRAISRGKNLRATKIFEDYRLATAKDSKNDLLSEGALISDDDRDVRNRYRIECNADGSGGRPLEANDTRIDAWEIFRCNDARRGIHWTQRATNGAARARQLKTDPFTGQTGLAASFGLLQMTFVTAITEQGWKGDAQGNRNPSLLLDTLDAHQRNAGSLEVGTFKVAKDFASAVDETGIDSFKEMLLAFGRAWKHYNAGELGYAADIVLKIPNYFAVPRVPVLGGSQ
jgi:hypothetical protein